MHCPHDTQHLYVNFKPSCTETQLFITMMMMVVVVVMMMIMIMMVLTAAAVVFKLDA